MKKSRLTTIERKFQMKESGFTVIELFIVIVLLIVGLGGSIGWGLNIYKLTETNFQEPYKAEIIRGVGVFAAPLGCIIGYIDIQDN